MPIVLGLLFGAQVGYINGSLSLQILDSQSLGCALVGYSIAITLLCSHGLEQACTQDAHFSRGGLAGHCNTEPHCNGPGLLPVSRPQSSTQMPRPGRYLSSRGMDNFEHQGPMEGAYRARPAGVIWQHIPGPGR